MQCDSQITGDNARQDNFLNINEYVKYQPEGMSIKSM